MSYAEAKLNRVIITHYNVLIIYFLTLVHISKAIFVVSYKHEVKEKKHAKLCFGNNYLFRKNTP